MKVVITGSSSGIGKAACLKFLEQGHQVFGLDILKAAINHSNYTHFIADISTPDSLPAIDGVEILVNNAGIQTAKKLVNSVCAKTSGTTKCNETAESAEPLQSKNFIPDDINVNLLGTIYVTEKYAFQPSIKSVLFNASVSAISGNEFPAYVASKAGVVGYMKHVAIRLANEFHATSNALCFGGVQTELNAAVMNDKNLWNRIMDVTPLKRWASAEQAAEWIYFLTAVNTSCTGQAIEVSGGERNCADLFVWPEE